MYNYYGKVAVNNYLMVFFILYSVKEVNDMLNKWKKARNEKGQGLTEYVLILAFVGALAFMMFSGDGFLGTMKNIVTNTRETFATIFDGENKYLGYFKRWHDKKSKDIKKEADISERILADKEALAIIARKFIGLDEEGVGALIGSITGSSDGTDKFNNMLNYQQKSDSEYSGIMVPLSYQRNNLDSENGYIWLNQNTNIGTVKMFAPDAKIYDRDDPNNPSNNGVAGTNKHETALADRIFYSDDMLSDATNPNYRMVTLEVHYNQDTHLVDSARIAVLKTQDPAKMNTAEKVSHLYLNVTKTDYNEIGL